MQWLASVFVRNRGTTLCFSRMILTNEVVFADLKLYIPLAKAVKKGVHELCYGECFAIKPIPVFANHQLMAETTWTKISTTTAAKETGFATLGCIIWISAMRLGLF